MPTTKQYDIIITDPSTSEQVGLNLSRDKNGTPVYQEYDDEYILNQQTSVPGYDALPYEKEFVIILDDWRSGFGLQSYDPNDPKRYDESYNMDLRFRGRAQQSYTPTGIALPTDTDAAATYLNMDMELAATGWTNGARDGAQFHSGSFSWVPVSGAGDAYQDATNWSTAWRGDTAILVGWAYTGNARIGLDDNGNTEWSAAQTKGAAWQHLAVAITISATADRLRILMDDNGTCYYDDFAIIHTALGKPSAMMEFNDKLYFAIGKCLYKLNAAGDDLDFVHAFATTISSLEVFSDDKLYIGQGVGAAYWEMNTSEVVTLNSLTNNTVQFMKRVYGTADTMWGNDTVSGIRYTANPADGGTNWSNPILAVDSSYNSITSLVSLDNTLYIGKEDRVFYVDSSGNIKILTDDTAHLTDSAGAKAMFPWKGCLYIPYKSALLEYDSGTFTWLNPSDYSTNLSAYAGDIQAIAGDERYLYIAIDNSTKIEIMAGHRETIDSTTSWVWHPIVDLTLTGAEKMYVSDVFRKTLWITSTSSSDSIYSLPLPTSYGDTADDANRSFSTAGTGYFTTPELHAGFKGDTKAFTKIVAELGHVWDTDIYFECWYKVQGDTSWTDAGDLKGSATSREHTLYLSSVSSKWIQLKIIGVTDATTKTPILKRLEVRGILYPLRRKLIYCVVKVKDESINKMGIKKSNRYTLEKNCMDNLRAATWPTSMIDIDGSSIYVKSLPLPSGTPRFTIVKAEKGTEQYRHYNLYLQVVTLS